MMNRRELLRLASVLAGGACLPALAAETRADTTGQRPERPYDVPYVPTRDEVVEKMLRLADTGPTDIVYDLGCGDGRIPIAAALRFGARGVGIDIDPELIAQANANAQAAKVGDRVQFVVGDLFKADIGEASVVTLYLLPSLNQDLKPKLLADLKPGTRIVSHDFDMGPGWPPEFTQKRGRDTIYRWRVSKKKR